MRLDLLTLCQPLEPIKQKERTATVLSLKQFRELRSRLTYGLAMRAFKP